MSVKSASRQSGGPKEGATTYVAVDLSVEHAMLGLLRTTARKRRKALIGPAQPACASRGAPSRSLRLGGKLRRQRTHHSVARGGNRLVVVSHQVRHWIAVRPAPGPWRNWLGRRVRRLRLDHRGTERRRLLPLERVIHAASERGCRVHTRHPELVEPEEVDDGLSEARVRMPLRLDALFHRATEHEERDARATENLKAAWMDRIRHPLGVGSRDVVSVAAPVVPGEDEDGVGPIPRLHDRIDALPDEVVAAL